jgi:hypothetical protein
LPEAAGFSCAEEATRDAIPQIHRAKILSMSPSCSQIF